MQIIIVRILNRFLRHIMAICCGVLSLLFILSPTYTLAASFDFEPSSNQYLQGCKNSINIMANATNQESNAADIELYFNPNEVEIMDSLPDMTGTQIKPGNAYETYFGNDVNVTIGRIRLAGASFVSNHTTKKVFASIDFKSKPGILSTNFNIKFDGVSATLDSNIADSSTSDDLLNSVTNGSYTFKTGDCEADKTPPVITFQTPTKYAVNYPLDGLVNIKITDNKSGVDLSKTVITINDDIYTPNSSEVTYTGTALNYTFSIKPRNNFYTDKESVIKVSTVDLAGNKSNDTNVFNIPIPIIKEKICPDANQGGTTIVLPPSSSTSSSGSSSTSTSSGGSVNANNSTGSSSGNSSGNVAANVSGSVSSGGATDGDTTNSQTSSSQNNSNNLAYLILARTGGSMKDYLMYNYWWGIPLLLIILFVAASRYRWMKQKDKTTLR